MADAVVLRIAGAAVAGGLAIVVGLFGQRWLKQSRARQAPPADIEPANTIALAQLPSVAALRGNGTYRVTIQKSPGRPAQDQTVSGTAEAAMIVLVAGLRRAKSDRICIAENRAELLRITRPNDATGAAEIVVVAPIHHE